MNTTRRLTPSVLYLVLAITILASFYPALSAHAASPAHVCIAIPYNLHIGSTDDSSGGAVTSLQTFLADEGYFDQSLIGTGRFGPMTYRSVVKYQAAQNISGTGFVGVLTRASIQRVSCGTPSTKPISLYTLSPSAGPTGTSVTITGFGFTGSNTILMDGSVAARNVPITSSIAVACTTDPSCHGGIRQSISFTVPTSLSPNCPSNAMCMMSMRLVTPGTYAITVTNESGSSSVLNFLVTGDSSNPGPVSLQGLDAPSSLAVGQAGTWTVHATTPTSTGTLHYSVVWGDEATYTTMGAMMPQPFTKYISASFTHSYQQTGTYTPIFTVSDDYGHTVSTSASVSVGTTPY